MKIYLLSASMALFSLLFFSGFSYAADLGNTLTATITANCTVGLPVKIVPETISVVEGQDITIDIMLNPVDKEIYGIQYDIEFDKNMLAAKSHNPSNFLKKDGNDTLLIINKIDNGAGIIQYGETRKGTETGIRGSGVVASAFFTSKQQGTVSFRLENLILSDRFADSISSSVSCSDTAIFGVDAGATEGFDSSVDMAEPPAPPGDYIRAYFSFPENEGYAKELDKSVFPIKDNIRMKFVIEKKGQSPTVNLSWNVSELGKKYKTVILENPETRIDMKAKNNYIFNASASNDFFVFLEGVESEVKALPNELDKIAGIAGTTEKRAEDVEAVQLVQGILAKNNIKPEKIEKIVNVSQNTIKVKIKEKKKILGLIPASIESEIVMDVATQNIKSVDRPWWSFLFW